jgi:hypothetical protein
VSHLLFSCELLQKQKQILKETVTKGKLILKEIVTKRLDRQKKLQLVKKYLKPLTNFINSIDFQKL